jgi:hypothetical protein
MPTPPTTDPDRPADSLETSDAARIAEQLAAAVLAETRRANTPWDHISPDAGHGPNEYPEDHSAAAADRLVAHLSAHPELAQLDQWRDIFAAMAAEDAYARDHPDADGPPDRT